MLATSECGASAWLTELGATTDADHGMRKGPCPVQSCLLIHWCLYLFAHCPLARSWKILLVQECFVLHASLSAWYPTALVLTLYSKTFLKESIILVPKDVEISVLVAGWGYSSSVELGLFFCFQSKDRNSKTSVLWAESLIPYCFIISASVSHSIHQLHLKEGFLLVQSHLDGVL